MCRCKGHGCEVGSLTTKGWSASEAVDANMPKVSIPEALLVHVQGEDCGMGMTLPLAMFEGILVFV